MNFFQTKQTAKSQIKRHIRVVLSLKQMTNSYYLIKLDQSNYTYTLGNYQKIMQDAIPQEAGEKEPSQAVNNQLSRSEKETKRFDNPYRKLQIILSLFLVAMSMLWVQITVQRYGPFVRTAQCFFNRAILLHGNKTTYESSNTTFLRDDYYYNFKQIQKMFTRISQISEILQKDSLFKMANQGSSKTDNSQVKLLVIYRHNIPLVYHQYKTKISKLQEIATFFNQTLLDRTFYKDLWKIQLFIQIPLIYRQETVVMNLHFQGQIYSSLLLQFTLNVDILNSNKADLEEQQIISQNNLGVRKRNNNHDMSLTLPYLKWVILLLLAIVFVLQVHFIVRKNQNNKQKIQYRLKQEHEFEQNLQTFRQKVENTQQQQLQEKLLFNSAFVGPSEQLQEPFSTAIQKIGIYFLLEVGMTIFAFFGILMEQSGLVCFFSWAKILVYLSQIKNKLMLGTLLQLTISTYLRIFFNIMLIILGFVLFNMLVFTRSLKFQTVQLGFLEYGLNFFQQGIYNNFVYTFNRLNFFASLYNLFQIIFIVIVGSNLLISILANEVLKNSNLKNIQKMVDKMNAKCPVCSLNFQSFRNLDQSQKPQSQKKLVSNILKDLSLQKMRSHHLSSSSAVKSQFNIVIKYPALYPFFPDKKLNSLQKQQNVKQQLKQRDLQLQIKRYQENLAKKPQFQPKTREMLDKMKYHLQRQKRINIQLANPTRQDQITNSLYNRLMFLKQCVYKAIPLMPKIEQNVLSSSVNQAYQQEMQILNDLLSKVSILEAEVEQTIKK